MWKSIVKRRTAGGLLCCVWFCIAILGTARAGAAEPPVVAATVGSQPIHVAEVERVVQQLVKDRPAERATRARLHFRNR